MGTSHWPAFNIADIAICLGAGLVVLDGFLAPSEKTQAHKS
ncbi:MAG: signal peptidase II [Plesiomonas sp.]